MSEVEAEAEVVQVWESDYSSLLDAALCYLSLHDTLTDKEQFLAGLPVVGNQLTEDLLARAIDRIDFSVKWHSSKSMSKIQFPCCVSLNSTEYAVVIARTSECYQLLDTTDNKTINEVPHQTIEDIYAGRVCYIRPSIKLFQSKHSVTHQAGHWFWSNLLVRKKGIFNVILSSFFANIIAVTVSLFALQVYDRVIPGQSEATLWVLVVGAGIAIFFEAVLRISRARIIDEAGKELEQTITRELFEKLIGMRLDKPPASPGSLVHMIREFAAVREFFTTAAVGVVADLPFVFVFLLLIYGIAGPIVWIVIIGALLTIIPSLLMQNKMARLSKETMGGMSSASRLLTEVAYGLETVRTTRAEARFQKCWEEIVTLNSIKTSEQRSLSAFLTFWAMATQQCVYIAAVVGGVYMVFAGEFTVGSIIAVSILSTRTLSPITQLASLLSKWQNMKSSLQALDMIMTSEQEHDPKRTYLRRPRLKGHINFKEIEFTHPGAATVSLKINELNILPGTRLALLGGNGSGKSTFLRLLAGLYQPEDGKLLLDGLDVRQIDPTDLRSNIGLLSQEVWLFRGTIRENLLSNGRIFTDAKLFEALDFGGLGNFVRHHPRGLDIGIFDGGKGLSTGQRQSLGLARVYLQDPSILLLDEPTAALDQHLEQQVVNRLGMWIGNRTCIVATHRMPILSIMSRVGVMSNGQLTLEGPRDEVLKRLSAPAETNMK